MFRICKNTVIACSFFVSFGAFAQSNCSDVPDAAKRLACFDALQKSNTKKAPKVSNATRQKLELEAQKNALAAAEAEKIREEQEVLKKAAEAAEAERLKAEQELKLKAEAEKTRKLEAIKDAKVIMRALQKLDTRISTGISYRDYPSLLSDVKFEFQSFDRSKNSAIIPNFSDTVANALTNHSDAYFVWEHQFSHHSNLRNTTKRIYDSAMVDFILKKYPETLAFKAGVILYLEPTRSAIWSAASANTNKAQRLLDEYEASLQ